MGLFSGMEKFGLGKFSETKIMEEKKTVQKKVVEKQIDTRTPEEKEADNLLDKKYQCPVCDVTFTSKIVRAGKVKLSGKDTDLRPIYEGMDPLKYDVITCDICGYSALTRYFGKLATRQIKEIKEQLGGSFTGIDFKNPIYSYDEAIERYKLALLTVIIKGGKNSERGYVCLKLAWVLRGKRATLKSDDPVFKELYEEELESLENAYNCFNAAMLNEQFPIAGMDENTLLYVMADIARKLKKFEESARLVGKILTSRAASDRLKNQTLELKELIKQDMQMAKTTKE